MDPCIDHLVDSSQDKALDQAQIEIFTDQALLLPLFHDLRHNIQVHAGHLLDLLLHKTRTLVSLGLVQDGHVPVALKLLQVSTDQVSKFVNGVIGPVDLLPEATEDLLGLIVEKLYQNIVLIFKIEVDRSIGDTGFSGDLCNGRLKEPLLGEYLYGCVQYSPIFVVCLFSLADGTPPNR